MMVISSMMVGKVALRCNRKGRWCEKIDLNWLLSRLDRLLGLIMAEFVGAPDLHSIWGCMTEGESCRPSIPSKSSHTYGTSVAEEGGRGLKA